KKAGMAVYAPDVLKQAFEASYVTIFIYHGDELIGIGRALSDGAYQAAVYDCAVSPEFQGKGVGRLIITHILSALETCNIILYASPGKEGFYQKYGFRRMKTGMARFVKSEHMSERGFTE
ncbi:MAG: GNAT family N-acetyltransferase, partial [Desulfobacterales bacterium]|nr:GNAT family N-acetyltransferase [Desulfobacterales bacterium]